MNQCGSFHSFANVYQKVKILSLFQEIMAQCRCHVKIMDFSWGKSLGHLGTSQGFTGKLMRKIIANNGESLLIMDHQ